jgi:hypothetical protein
MRGVLFTVPKCFCLVLELRKLTLWQEGQFRNSICYLGLCRGQRSQTRLPADSRVPEMAHAAQEGSWLERLATAVAESIFSPLELKFFLED